MRYVTRESIAYKAAPYGFIAEIPAGTPCIPADNLPDGSGFWACAWEGSTFTEEAASWERNYGFLLGSEEVEAIDAEPGASEGVAIVYRARRDSTGGTSVAETLAETRKTRSDLILEALADVLASKTARAEQAVPLRIVQFALTSVILDFSTSLGQLPAGSRGDADAFLGMLADKTAALGARPLVLPDGKQWEIDYADR